MALANLGWGYTKIRDALRTGLKIELGRTTVANILLEADGKVACGSRLGELLNYYHRKAA